MGMATPDWLICMHTAVVPAWLRALISSHFPFGVMYGVLPSHMGHRDDDP